MAAPAQTLAASSGSMFTAPTWIKTFYSKFPLVVLEQEDELDWKIRAREAPDQAVELWIHPPSTSAHPHSRSWISSSPSSIRTQLLFLLRETTNRVPVTFRNWSNESAAPGGRLPSLFIPGQERLLPTDEIRGWLETTYPLKGKGKEHQGLPSQEAYDKALALSQLVLGDLYPAYLASRSKRSDTFHLLFSRPPPLLAGLTTPLPASLTGDAREVDTDEILRKGVAAVEAIDAILDEEHWALGAKNPTALDALIASHLYVIFSLPENSVLRTSVESSTSLGRYVERVLDHAEGQMRK
ncbi:hypothetical protein IAU60_000599 [Kwoniella sp. DSM 27419]